MRKKVLLITGSLNQTSQMQQIASLLPEYDCWFSQVYSDTHIAKFLKRYTPVMNGTVMSDYHREKTEKYLREHGFQIDYKAEKNEYDLVVFCSDMVIPDNLRNIKQILQQSKHISHKKRLAFTVP